MGATSALEFLLGGPLGGPLLNQIGNAFDSKKPASADLPDPNKAKTDAASTVANQRQILLASGGQTDYTGGLGILTGSDVSKTSLLGG